MTQSCGAAAAIGRVACFSSPLNSYPASFQHRAAPHNPARGIALIRLLIGSWLATAVVTAQVPRRDREELPNFDVRESARTPTPANAAASAAATSSLRTQIRGGRVDRDALHGSAGYVRSTSRFLTGPTAAIPNMSAQAQSQRDHQVVRSFVDGQPGLFGHPSNFLSSAALRREYTTRHNGLRTIVWQQQLDDIPVFGATFQAHVTARGELVNVSSQFLDNLEQAAQRGAPGRAARMASPAVTAREAVAIAARNLGDEAVTGAQVTPQDVPQGSDKRQSFRAEALADAHARYVWLPMDSSTLRLAWEVICTSRRRSEMFRIVVDAETGAVQIRQSLTSHISMRHIAFSPVTVRRRFRPGTPRR